MKNDKHKTSLSHAHCSIEESPHSHTEHSSCGCHEEHSHKETCHCTAHSHSEHPGECSCHHGEEKYPLLPIFITLPLLLICLLFDKVLQPEWFMGFVRLFSYFIALFPVVWNPLREGFELLFKRGDLFNEIILMLVATIGAFAIGEYAEAIILMLLYSLGEYFEHKASEKARGSISSLIDSRPERVVRITAQGLEESIAPELCAIGDIIQMKPGERVAFDGVLLTENATFDISALTGESLPLDLTKGAEIQAGAIVLGHPSQIAIAKPYGESTLARILQQVEDASENKPQKERFIRRFSRGYTPAVFALALLTVLIPYLWSLFVPDYSFIFKDWFYIALVLLVTSCPCALIISIPLSYFSGVGAASRYGLIFKGARFLEILPRIKKFIFDKTGTLTKGRFIVTRVEHQLSSEDLKTIHHYVFNLEEQSTHPIAKAICKYLSSQANLENASLFTEREEIPGMGMVATTSDKDTILVGNKKLLEYFEVDTSRLPLLNGDETAIYVAKNRNYECCYILRDDLKEHALFAVSSLQEEGASVTILSGDSPSVVKAVGDKLHTDEALGGLLPQDKITHTKRLAEDGVVAFVGDGINDAPVMALCDLSFAMGGIGSDAAIEAADVVIQSDDPSLVVKAVKIARKTNKVAWQNIIFSLGVKGVVMILAYLGISTLVMAIFADVGVTLLAVLNAVRLLHTRF